MRIIPCLLATLALPLDAKGSSDEMFVESSDGSTLIRAKPVEPRFRNPWSKTAEREFQERGRRILAAQAKLKVGLNTYFENEKRGYGFLMAQVLRGDRGKALAALQARDHQHQEWHRETAGIDYYAAFTLKHQIRKYFYFGDLLEPGYRRQMFEGARAWTARDPMRRPHYAYKGPKPGWGPDAKNRWVDIRSTENLFLMRETSVYLMAEETGNRNTAEHYKRRLLDYAATLHRIGIGEWDSENYHGHSLGPLLNLYDFAKDPEVKLAAKACLDWFCAAGALKYWRGAFNGPTKRDYNHAQPFGGSAASILWVYFGDTPAFPSHWESDEVHLLTSAYRPPEAVVNLAHRRFTRPLTLFASKPPYSATTGFQREATPEHLETHHYGNHFQIGSLAAGTSPGASDVNGFKILLRDKERGAIALQAVPGPDPNFPGSPLYQDGKVSGPNRVAQDGELAIWIVRDGHSPWLWLVPDGIDVSTEAGVTFLRSDDAWVSLHPLGTSTFRVDDELAAQLSEPKKPRFAGHRVVAARGAGADYCGMAVRVGDREGHGSFADFKKLVLAAEIDSRELSEGIVRVRFPDGKHLGFHWNDDPHDLGVWRNGKRHDWARHRAHLYDTPGRERPLVHAAHGAGRLYVEAGGVAFASRVDDDGMAEFVNGKPEPVWKTYASWPE